MLTKKLNLSQVHLYEYDYFKIFRNSLELFPITPDFSA
jgi:hypothetical protein